MGCPLRATSLYFARFVEKFINPRYSILIHLLNSRYTVSKLSVGTHTFRIKSISLALNGSYTEYAHVHIYGKYDASTIIGIIVAALSVLLGSIFYYIFMEMKKRGRIGASGGDRAILLRDMVVPTMQLESDEPFDLSEDL